jgi:hypothetical protein
MWPRAADWKPMFWIFSFFHFLLLYSLRSEMKLLFRCRSTFVFNCDGCNHCSAETRHHVLTAVSRVHETQGYQNAVTQAANFQVLWCVYARTALESDVLRSCDSTSCRTFLLLTLICLSVILRLNHGQLLSGKIRTNLAREILAIVL